MHVVLDILTSIVTCAIAALSLLFSTNMIRIRKLHVIQLLTFGYEEGSISLFITIENSGTVPIIINSYGTYFAHNNICIDINDYLVESYEPILIKPNEAKIIEYKHYFGRKYTKESEIDRSREYQLFSKAHFMARDTTGKFYLAGTHYM